MGQKPHIKELGGVLQRCRSANLSGGHNPKIGYKFQAGGLE